MIRAAVLLGVMVGCGSSRSTSSSTHTAAIPAPTNEAEMTVHDRINSTLGLAPSPEISDLVDALAADWSREAGTGKDRGEIVDVLAQDLAAAASDVAAGDRAGLLQARVTGRMVRQLSSATYTLAEQLHLGAIESERAVAQATPLLAQAQALRERVATQVPERWRAELQTPLLDALLEASWVSQGGDGPMSGRLARFVADRSEAPVPPPDLTP